MRMRPSNWCHRHLASVLAAVAIAACQPDTDSEREAAPPESGSAIESTTLDTIRAAPIEAARPQAPLRTSPPPDSAFLAKRLDARRDWYGADGWEEYDEPPAAVGFPHFWNSYQPRIRPEHVYFNVYGDLTVGDSMWVHIGRGERVRGMIGEIYDGGGGLCGLGCDEGGSCHRRAVLDVAAADTARIRAAEPVFLVTHLDHGDSPLRNLSADEDAVPPDSIAADLDDYMDRALESHMRQLADRGIVRRNIDGWVARFGIDSARVTQSLITRLYPFGDGRMLVRAVGDWRREDRTYFALGVDLMLEADSVAAWSVVADASLFYDGELWNPPVEDAVGFYANWFDFDADGDPEFARRGIGYESCSLTVSEWRRSGRVLLHGMTDGV